MFVYQIKVAEEKLMIHSLNGIQMILSIYHFHIEYIQLKNEGLSEYMADSCNYFDIFNFITYTSFFVLRIYYIDEIQVVINEKKFDEQDEKLRFLSPIIVLFKFIKIMYILRVSKTYG